MSDPLANDPLAETIELVRLAQRGDGAAINELFGRYYERVRRVVGLRIGPQLRARLETEDIVQHAFAKAFEKFDGFEMRDEGSLLHWIAEIAERQVRDAVDLQNARKRRPPTGHVCVDLDASGTRDVDLDPPASGVGPATKVGGWEEERAIDQCVDELPEQFRRVIVLRDYEGLEWQEIRKVLGKNSESAARDLHQRALLELTLLLRRRGIGPQ